VDVIKELSDFPRLGHRLSIVCQNLMSLDMNHEILLKIEVALLAHILRDLDEVVGFIFCHSLVVDAIIVSIQRLPSSPAIIGSLLKLSPSISWTFKDLSFDDLKHTMIVFTIGSAAQWSPCNQFSIPTICIVGFNAGSVIHFPNHIDKRDASHTFKEM
jgi:hypothetical protein